LELDGDDWDGTSESEAAEDAKPELETSVRHTSDVVHMLSVFIRRATVASLRLGSARETARSGPSCDRTQRCSDHDFVSKEVLYPLRCSQNDDDVAAVRMGQFFSCVSTVSFEAFMELVFGYLTTHAYAPKSLAQTEKALLVSNPLQSTVLLPEEVLVLVLNAKEGRFTEVASPWVLLEDHEEGRGTLTRIECRAQGSANEREPWPPNMVVVRATRRVSFRVDKVKAMDTSRLSGGTDLTSHQATTRSPTTSFPNSSTNAMFIHLKDLEFDANAVMSHTLGEMIRQNLTVLDSRLSLVGDLQLRDEVLVRNQLVARLLAVGKKTVFQTGQRVDDPELSLNAILALARSVLPDWDRREDQDGDLQSTMESLVSLEMKEVQCGSRWCGHSICHASDLMLNAHSFHINRFGYTCRLLISSRLHDDRTDHDLDLVPDTTDSWFPGFGWTSIHCTNCRNFLGFKFHPMDTGAQDSACFFGFISTYVDIFMAATTE
jgi:hypothetical protein